MINIDEQGIVTFDEQPAPSLVGAGTAFIETMWATYADLSSAFGEPNGEPSPDGKVDLEWIINTPTGLASVHNWKDGAAYGRDARTALSWSVRGSRKNNTTQWIYKALGI